MELSCDPEPSTINIESKQKKYTICKRGYSIHKSELDTLLINRIKDKLKVKANINTDYGVPPKPFDIYLESDKKLYLPKFYGLQELGNPSKIKLTKGEGISLSFDGELRDKQKPVVEKYLKSCQYNNDDNDDKDDNDDNENLYSLKTTNGGIISVGCGFGKTVLALYLVQKLSRKTLVIVHKEFLMKQWRDRILQYLPEARIGYIQGSKIDIDDKDIVIGMLQSISMKDYDKNVFKDFGFCIIDECHHIGAEVFSRSLFKINSFYMLGLSATPKRQDGLNKVFEWFIGPYIWREKNKEHKSVDVRMIYYDNLDPAYNKLEVNFRNKPLLPKMITNISKCISRNKLIVKLLIDICDDPNRKVLVLGDRREQLYELERILKLNNMSNVGYYIGGMKEDDLKRSELCQILLATYSMSSEGMDIPALDTLFLISSKSDIQQSVGRILRKDHEGRLPIVYDIVDNFSSFGNQGRKRLKYYLKNKYTVYSSQARDFDGDLDKVFRESKEFIEYKKPDTKKTIKKGVCLL